MPSNLLELIDCLAFGCPDAHAPVLFQFAPRALHFDIPIGREFRTDLVIRGRTSLDVFVNPGLTNFFKILADWAIRGYPSTWQTHEWLDVLSVYHR